MSYKIAVVGATGKVGQEMLNVLAESNIPYKEVVAIASKNSLGKEISFGEEEILKAIALEDYDFAGTDIALFSAGSEVSKVYAEKAAAHGCIVIDNSSYFRMHEDIPLIVPEVNPHHLVQFRKKNIIANPNCSAIQMLVALKPLHDLSPIKRLVVATYQSVSGAGKDAMDELYNQTKRIYMFQKDEPINFPKQIAFNVIPQIDDFMEDGNTKEEWKIVNETKKILSKEIELSVTCVRVPVFVGHSIAINVEFTNPISLEAAKKALKTADGVVFSDDEEYVTPVEIAQENPVFVSRLRNDPSVPYGLNMWVVADNLRKGAALNAVQILNELIKHHL
jgi:aspartate-semialdehyde dehydrogenase